jgi:hypothetical protein
MEKRSKKIIHGSDTITVFISLFGNKKSPCRHADEDADIIVVALSSIKPPYRESALLLSPEIKRIR